MCRDVSDMEGMLNTFLNFARGEALDDPERADPADIARAAVDRAVRSAWSVELGTLDDGSTSMLRPAALGRALDNLIGNAVRYGKRAIVNLHLSPDAITFSVEDDGPGIAEHERATALKPFSRLDKARNQDVVSGVGLGLAIASDIARHHGGTLVLGVSEKLGGLKVDIRLPR
jgi:two-component system osmolarity sensor histidine kinase EnvZ